MWTTLSSSLEEKIFKCIFQLLFHIIPLCGPSHSQHGIRLGICELTYGAEQMGAVHLTVHSLQEFQQFAQGDLGEALQEADQINEIPLAAAVGEAGGKSLANAARHSPSTFFLTIVLRRP